MHFLSLLFSLFFFLSLRIHSGGCTAAVAYFVNHPQFTAPPVFRSQIALAAFVVGERREKKSEKRDEKEVREVEKREERRREKRVER